MYLRLLTLRVKVVALQNTLQHTATHCIALHHTATYCNTLQHAAIYCYTLQPTAAHCSVRVNVPAERPGWAKGEGEGFLRMNK